MRILFAAWKLDAFVGGQLVTRDLAIALKRLGHEPIIYTKFRGRLSNQAGANGVRLITDYRELEAPPEIIHGQNTASLAMALREFPNVSAVLQIQGTLAMYEPFFVPRLMRYVAVDDRCRDWVLKHPGIPADRVRVLLNFVDLQRYKPRPPLPPKPRRALIFSNYAVADGYSEPIRRACERFGITVDLLGGDGKQFSTNPEHILPPYDLVFAKARCAIEALAVGNAVVLCDFPGLGPMVTVENYASLRRMNFGAGVLTQPLDTAAIADEIRKYDPADAAQVSTQHREVAGLDRAARDWVALFAEAIEEARGIAPDAWADSREIRRVLRQWRSVDYGARVAAMPLVGSFLFRTLRSCWRLLGEPFTPK